jgi:hypothetical protein
LQYPSHPLLRTMGEHGQSQQVLCTCLQGNRSRGLRCSVCLFWLLLLLWSQAGQPRSFGDLENELLKGQKLQGVLTSDEVQVRHTISTHMRP